MGGVLVAGTTSKATNTVSGFTCTLGAACLTNDRVIVQGTVETITSGEVISSMTGTFCGTFTKDIESAEVNIGGGLTKESTWSAPVTSNGTPVVTVNFTGGSCTVSAHAVRGLDTSVGAGAVDASGSATSTSGNSFSCTTSGATTATGEWVDGGCGDDGESYTFTKGAAYTTDANSTNAPSANAEVFMEWNPDSGATGTKTLDGTFTGTSVGWACTVVVYKLSGGAAFTPAFRKTLSGIGSGVGKRQPHGW